MALSFSGCSSSIKTLAFTFRYYCKVLDADILTDDVKIEFWQKHRDMFCIISTSSLWTSAQNHKF